MHTSGKVREEKGQWFLHWEGADTQVSKTDAEKLQAQVTVRLRVSELRDSALDWATAEALSYKPTLQGQRVPGTLLDGGILTAEYDNCYVVAHYEPRRRYGEFRPSSDPRQSSPLFDTHRISIEVAGDGWAALKNDCFGPGTWSKSIKGESRVIAGLRCLVNEVLGSVVEVPVELVPPNVRLAALQLRAAA